MKYLFINSVAGFGSTGRIAAEQCRELMKEGHQCVLAFGRDKANCDDIPTVQIGTSADVKLMPCAAGCWMTMVSDPKGQPGNFCSGCGSLIPM